mgnify:CR=1 FL=1
MNIINFELKNNKKFLIGFLISVSLISLLFISFYPMLKNDLQAFSDVMRNYPAIIQNMFGFINIGTWLLWYFRFYIYFVIFGNFLNNFGIFNSF